MKNITEVSLLLWFELKGIRLKPTCELFGIFLIFQAVSIHIVFLALSSLFLYYRCNDWVAYTCTSVTQYSWIVPPFKPEHAGGDGTDSPNGGNIYLVLDSLTLNP